jgi:hypothetical protein
VEDVREKLLWIDEFAKFYKFQKVEPKLRFAHWVSVLKGAEEDDDMSQQVSALKKTFKK